MTPFVEWILTLPPQQAHPNIKGRRITSVPPAAKSPSTRILRNILVRVAANSLSITSQRYIRSNSLRPSFKQPEPLFLLKLGILVKNTTSSHIVIFPKTLTMKICTTDNILIPPGFTLEMHMHHEDHEHEHVHVGTSADQNGDGYICIKPITPAGSIHVHIDNNVR